MNECVCERERERRPRAHHRTVGIVGPSRAGREMTRLCCENMPTCTRQSLTMRANVISTRTMHNMQLMMIGRRSPVLYGGKGGVRPTDTAAAGSIFSLC